MPTEPPYTIVRVTALMDINGRMQGEPGYNDALVLPGDELRGINGTDVLSLPVGGVRPTFARSSSGASSVRTNVLASLYLFATNTCAHLCR